MLSLGRGGRRPVEACDKANVFVFLLRKMLRIPAPVIRRVLLEVSHVQEGAIQGNEARSERPSYPQPLRHSVRLAPVPWAPESAWWVPRAALPAS